MIVVIADDLTGAAELGGIGLRYQLRTEVTTSLDNFPKAELLVIDLDSRSKSRQDAVLIVEKVCRQLQSLEQGFIFKKIDSVLRGHVLPEVKKQMELLGYQRTLVVSANPALERTIIDGIYLFKGKPIHGSSFAHDPEFPINSSLVTDMLRAGKNEVYVLSKDEDLPKTGIVVGEVQTGADLSNWAKRMDPGTMAVGASGFFEAILQKLDHVPATEINKTVTFQQPALYVCGTTFQKSRDAIKHESESGSPVCYLPEDLIKGDQPSDEQYNLWINEIITLTRQHGKAIIAIDPKTTEETNAYTLRERMAVAVAGVLRQAEIRELFLEGGSTAAAILRRSGITNFHPTEQLAPGVIRMKDNLKHNLYFTLKPGSYNWPPGFPFLNS